MTPLPPQTVSAARDLLTEGWRPDEKLGQVLVPVGDQRGGLQLTHDATWQAMCMARLLADGKVRG